MCMRKLSILLTVFMFFSILTGCTVSLDGSDENQQYGSLLMDDKSARLNYANLDVSSINTAKVTVIGNGISDDISTVCNIVNGYGNFKFDRIPVGKNRIVVIQGIDAYGNEINDAVLKTVIDINPGKNVIDTINRSVSIKGFIYSVLYENGVNISSLTEAQEMALNDVTPTLDDCNSDLNRINYELIAEDFKNNSLKDISFYISFEKYLKRITMEQSVESTAENPVFCVNAFMSDGSVKNVTDKVEWELDNPEILSIESGKVSLITEGKTKFRAKYSENSAIRYSPYANLDVIQQNAKSNYIYLDINSEVNYAKADAAVCAWMWGTGLSSSWYQFEKFDDSYLRLEIPLGAEKMVIARGKSLTSETSWNGLYNCWNQTSDLNVYNKDGQYDANTIRINEWNGSSGEWLYVDHGDTLVDKRYAKITMEPSEDDVTLESVEINGSPVYIAKKMFYTIPYETDSAAIIVKPNYSEAQVTVEPALIQSVDTGSFKEFKITVKAKNGNSDTYVVKVSRSSSEPLNSLKNKKRCYIDAPEEKTVTIVYDLDTWADTKESIGTLTVRGSFTKVYNPATKKWIEDENNFTLNYDPIYNWYSITVPFDKIKRPGFSGQPEYRFYKNGSIVDMPDFLDKDYRFEYYNGDNKAEYMLILFESDFENSQRLLKLEENRKKALEIKEINEFNLDNEEDLCEISNFRQVPGTVNLYRSYHPFYPSHEFVPTEQIRMEQVQKFMIEKGIKNDINLCNNRYYTEGKEYTVNNETYNVKIPDFYKEMHKNKHVLYVGDEDFGGNGIIPSANFVYYYSDSALMIEWINEIFDFIINEENEGPFLIHCEIGVDRTGFFSALIASLCGASWNQIVVDFEKSSDMGIGEVRDSKILKYSFENMLKVQDISQLPNLKASVEEYLLSSGISLEKIESFVKKITIK